MSPESGSRLLQINHQSENNDEVLTNRHNVNSCQYYGSRGTTIFVCKVFDQKF